LFEVPLLSFAPTKEMRREPRPEVEEHARRVRQDRNAIQTISRW
jgi:hypothetical protein